MVRRSRADSVSSHASYTTRVSDSAKLFANHDRMTDFEREHYHPLNILPSRPCLAVFRPPDKDMSSADIFKELREIDIPVTAVRCLQRNPSGYAIISFSTSVYRKTFLDNSPGFVAVLTTMSLLVWFLLILPMSPFMTLPTNWPTLLSNIVFVILVPLSPLVEARFRVFLLFQMVSKFMV